MSSSSTQDKERRIVVLISGSGTNLQALIDAQNTAALPHARIVHVLSNRKAAYGLTRAANASPPIPTSYLALQPYLKAHPGATRDDYDAAVAQIVLAQRPDLVVLAGWMHVLGERFLDAMEMQSKAQPSDPNEPSGVKASASEGTPIAGRSIPVINLHPALPGAFDGANAIERAYAAFQEGKIDKAGAMVHRVIKEVDRGEPIVVREVPIEKGESLEEFEKRLHSVEWEIIVLAASITLARLEK